MQFILDKLAPKAQVPSDRQFQISYFAKVADSFSDLNNLDLQKSLQILQLIIQYQFPSQVHQVMTNVVVIWISKITDQQIVSKCLDTIIQHLNKKGVISRSICLQILVTYLNMEHDIPNIPYPLLQEIGQTVSKLLKISDVQIRLQLSRTFKQLYIVNQFKPDIAKYSVKFAQNEKSDQLREAGLKNLIFLIKNDANLSQYHENILSIAFKFDLPSSYKFFKHFIFIQQNLLNQKKTDKKQPQQPQITEKERITKLFTLLNENLSRVQSNQIGNIILAYKKYLTKELESNGQVIVRGAYEVTTSCISRINNDDPCLHSIYKKSQQLCAYLTHKLNKNRKELLDYFLDKIKKKNQKIYVYKIILKGLNILIDTMGSNIFDEKRSKPQDYIEGLFNVFSVPDQHFKPLTIQQPLQVSIFRNIFQIVESLFLENKKWQYNIITLLMNFSKINQAEYSISMDPSLAQVLGYQLICLVLLIKQLDTNLHSIPYEVANQVWDTSKEFIAKYRSLARIGWILMSELMMISFFASNAKLKEVLLLIQTDLEKMPKEHTIEVLDQYRTIGLMIVSLNTGPLQKQLQDSAKKFMAQQLMQFYQILQQLKNSVQAQSARLVFFWALRMISPKNYSSQINLYVQMCVDDVILSTSPWEEVDFNKQGHFLDECRGEAVSEFAVAIHTLKFLGHIMATNAFTSKNKQKLIEYLQTNLQSLVNQKDQQKNRILAYLYCLLLVSQKLNQYGSNEFNEQLFQMCDICWTIENQQIQQLTAQVYATTLSIKDTIKQDQLNSLLQSKSLLHPTVIYLIEELVTKNIPEIELHIQNLYMKVISSLEKMSDDFAQKALRMLQFIDIKYQKSSYVFFLFAIMRDNPQEITHDVIIKHLRGGDQTSNHFHTIFSDYRCQNQSNKFTMLVIDYWIGKIKIETITDKILKMIESATLKLKYDKVMNYAKVYFCKYFQFLNEILDTKLNILDQLVSIINNLFMVQQVQSPENEVQTRQLLKSLIIKVLNDQQNPIQLLSKYILKEFMPIEEKQEIIQEQIPDSLVQQDNTQNQNRIPIHVRTRMFLLKRLKEQFSTITMEQDVFDFLFKIITSNYEEAKELSFYMFHQFFIKLNQESIKNNAAQIDSILSDTIKREENNPPNVNILNMRLCSKFFRHICKSDSGLAIKQINLLSKTLNQRKLHPNQFHSERQLLNMLTQRVISLGKIFKFLQQQQIKLLDFANQNQIDNFEYCCSGLIQDFFILLCSPRSHIRNYAKFNFVYNGKKSSYDSSFINQSLSKLMKVQLTVFYDNVQQSLIGYLLTQDVALEQLEGCYKKWQTQLPIQTVKQSQKSKRIGLQLLLQAISKQQLNSILDLMPLLIEQSISFIDLSSQIFFYISQVKQDWLQNYIQPIIFTVQQLYMSAERPNLKLINVQTLINLSSQGEEQDKIIQIIWDYLLNQNHEYDICKQLLSKLNAIQTDEDLIHLSEEALTIIVQKQNQQLRNEDINIILLFGIILKTDTQQQIINQFIQNNFSLIVNGCIKVINQKKQIDPSIMQLLLPNILFKLQSKQVETFVDMIKLFLLSFMIEQDKKGKFRQYLQLMILFIDPNIPQQTLQLAQQSLKHMVNQVGDIDLNGYPQIMKNFVEALQQQLQRERYLINIQQQVREISNCVIRIKAAGGNNKTKDVWLTLIYILFIYYFIFKKKMNKKQDDQLSQETLESSVTSVSDDFTDDIIENRILELDNQRDERIYRIVKNYNKQIEIVRGLGMDEYNLQMMEDIEKQKWDEIKQIQQQYDDIKWKLSRSFQQ